MLRVLGTLVAPANLTIAGLGTLAAASTGHIEVGTAGTAHGGQIVVDPAHTLVSSGALSAPVILNRGTITGAAGYGVQSPGAAVVTNSGTAALISGAQYGVYAPAGVATVVNQGKIIGSAGAGVYFGPGGTVTNSGVPALISGGQWGIESTGAATVSNQGTITGASAGGVQLIDGGGVTNNGFAARIAGTSAGIRFGAYGQSAGIGSLFNQGTIVATATPGIAADFYVGGTVTNSGAAALISGGLEGIVIGGRPGTVANYGTIIGASNFGIGVGLPSGGTIANGGGARITGGETGIDSGGGVGGGAVTISNQGTIVGTTSVGVALHDVGVVTNTGAAARIAGALAGVMALAPASGTVVNQGALIGTSTTASGVALRAGGTVTNSGAAALISGAQYGIRALAKALTATNQGTIAATSASGIGIYSGVGGTVINSGVSSRIAGGAFGIENKAGVFTLVNAGKILGTSTSGIGVYLKAGGTITNSGSISGAVAAVQFGSAAGNLFQDIPGAVVSGAVEGGTLTDTLELVSSAGIGIITSIGSQFTGFEVLTEDAGALWQLTGANTLLSTGNIAFGATATLSVAGSLTAPANLTLSGADAVVMAGGHVEVGTAGAATANQVAIDATHTLSLSGAAGATISGAVANAGMVLVTSSNAAFTGPITGAGTLQVNLGASLALKGAGNAPAAVADNGSINLAPGVGLTISGAATVGGTLRVNGGTVQAGSLSLANTGTLIGAGRAANAVANAGRIEANGGTLTMAGPITGAGTLQADSGTTLVLDGTSSNASSVLDNGTLIVGASGTLDVSGSINPTSAGLFVLTNASLLEVAADTAASTRISFLGASGDRLVVDFVGQFGTNVGLGTYAGPRLENFAALDTIDLKNLAFSGATIDSYTAATGLLQLHSGAAKATLLFDNATLGSGSFHLAADSGTGTVLTRN